MSPERETSYAGLPIPGYEECLAISFLLDADEGAPLSLVGLVDKITQDNVGIEQIIRHDIGLFVEEEADPKLSEDDVTEYIDGIEHGYELAIGCFTILFWRRSGYKTIEEYLSDAPNRIGEIPGLTSQERALIKTIRATQAYQEPTDSLTATDYLSRASLLVDICENELDRLKSHSTRPVQPEDNIFYLGFHHGFSNAIEMYIHAGQEQSLRNY